MILSGHSTFLCMLEKLSLRLINLGKESEKSRCRGNSFAFKAGIQDEKHNGLAAWVMDHINTVLMLSFLICSIIAVRGWFFWSRNVCYEKVGCFTSAYPFTNTKGLLPQPPEEIDTRFLLFTHRNPHRPVEIRVEDPLPWNQFRHFNRDHQTKVIIHGYFDSSDKHWVGEMVNALLLQGNYNVIVIDWRHGANRIIYHQAAANIRLVAVEVAQMLMYLMDTFHITRESIHLIGHSLGAHTAGYVGDKIKNIGRITGLDPAGPAFEDSPIQVRLDATDAIFVDVIHTDAEHLFYLGFGMDSPAGTVDFYPNGGKNQPGCPLDYSDQFGLIFQGDFNFHINFGCSHLRVLDLFIESINKETAFVSFPCPRDTVEPDKSCASCGSNGCSRMGFFADHDHGNGNYYLKTNDRAPFSIGSSDDDAVTTVVGNTMKPNA
ncbi:hypothetical protein CHS0354_022117 [Potamilus streckersoni]|uniref:Lipase domain-containing protein n=1 Tax=Potamilus streckersoni TaxID=2493646 RepID=A0AAE0RSV3_9BIVA|nr:hypothetical protein CHS0354_022117 [Potamilus streckersoni]